MHVARTMGFILQQQAKAESQMVSIQKLIATGMRMIVKLGEHVDQLTESYKNLAAAQKDLASAQKELASAQKVTETKLQGLIDALRRGPNGRQRKN